MVGGHRLPRATRKLWVPGGHFLCVTGPAWRDPFFSPVYQGGPQRDLCGADRSLLPPKQMQRGCKVLLQVYLPHTPSPHSVQPSSSLSMPQFPLLKRLTS